jgi:hypothetical protein
MHRVCASGKQLACLLYPHSGSRRKDQTVDCLLRTESTAQGGGRCDGRLQCADAKCTRLTRGLHAFGHERWIDAKTVGICEREGMGNGWEVRLVEETKWAWEDLEFGLIVWWRGD